MFGYWSATNYLLIRDDLCRYRNELLFSPNNLAKSVKLQSTVSIEIRCEFGWRKTQQEHLFPINMHYRLSGLSLYVFGIIGLILDLVFELQDDDGHSKLY